MAMYNDARWRRYRAMYLAAHPLCANPYGRHGAVVAATVVDHIIPHRGDYTKFWDGATNHQALCASCNSYKAAKFEGGFGNG
jgi:5-methylcytosine-specific restriction protein A